MCSTLFLPSAGDEYKNHPSRHGSIALPVPEVPKMSVGAICFTSSGSNGGCWLVLVFPRLFFFGNKGPFSPYATYANKKFMRLTLKKFFRRKKNDLCLFPQSSYAFPGCYTLQSRFQPSWSLPCYPQETLSLWIPFMSQHLNPPSALSEHCESVACFSSNGPHSATYCYKLGPTRVKAKCLYPQKAATIFQYTHATADCAWPRLPMVFLLPLHVVTLPLRL